MVQEPGLMLSAKPPWRALSPDEHMLAALRVVSA